MDEDQRDNTLSVDTRWYIDSKCRHLEDKINLKFDANALALEKYEAALKDRLDRMNEIRDAMKDQSAHFITRDELSAIETVHEEQWNILSQRIWLLFSGLTIVLIISMILHMWGI